MYRTHFYSNNKAKIKMYKLYSNKLNKLKNILKNNYYHTQFEKYRNNFKNTWKLIGTLILPFAFNRYAAPRNESCFRVFQRVLSLDNLTFHMSNFRLGA